MQQTLVSAAATRSIAPPIPFTIFPGIIQLARSPQRDTFIYTIYIYTGRNCPKMCQKWTFTCMAPKIVSPTCPPRIIPKLSSLEKKELPGIAVTVCFPALIKSGSTFENQSTMCLISSVLKGTKGIFTEGWDASPFVPKIQALPGLGGGLTWPLPGFFWRIYRHALRALKGCHLSPKRDISPQKCSLFPRTYHLTTSI